MNELTNKKVPFLRKLEKKFQIIPVIGDSLAIITAWISLTRQYFKKEYSDFPLGATIALIIIVVYSICPIDLVPDAILGFGQLDDVGVILACWKLIKSDVEDYRKWRDVTEEISDT